jgi:DNA-directed RNA polymerase subunit M/transcription elongation factor TFIIS
MGTLGPAGDWLRLSEHYGRMDDGELLALAQQKSELTDTAQQALASEMSRRGLKVESAKPVEPPRPEPDSDSPYAEDLKLVEVARVWSLADAAQLQDLLERAGIPVYMGREKAASADRVTSNFAEGVSVKVPQIGVPWARQAMENYSPQNEPPESGAGDEVEAYCPKCHSTEIFYDRVGEEVEAGEEESDEAIEDSPESFEWVCETCGNRWKDEKNADEE